MQTLLRVTIKKKRHDLNASTSAVSESIDFCRRKMNIYILSAITVKIWSKPMVFF